MQRLCVSDNRRFLTLEDKTPFFWLGDTAWELFHKLSLEEIDYYLRTRAGQGYNVVQAVLLSELDGIHTGNYYGKKPLGETEQGYDPALPLLEGEFSYWDMADAVIEMAGKHEIYLALLPSWGDKWNLAQGAGPVVFNEDNAYAYGRFLGQRYRNCNNIVWVMGGDRDLHTLKHFHIIEAMVKGIKDGGAAQLMTMHPMGCKSSSHYFHEAKWLDFNMLQSSHGSRNYPNYRMVETDYHKMPVKPTLDGEARYEDIAVGFQPSNGYFDEHDVRQSAYWAVFSGAFGYTYGHNSIWQMIRSTEINETYIMDWKRALTRAGSRQMIFLKELMQKYSCFDWVPASYLVKNNPDGANHMTVCKGSDYIMVYSPNGVPFEFINDMDFKPIKSLRWFCPRNGEILIQSESVSESGKMIPPSAGRGQDWVLIIR
ncbi:hypothetical protein HNQ56_002374 [Anaerotaenia torta]|uniref:glycoside hydrolase family 140 protein n=1 Tax=Anaerotaenia torta TaxID=433293 RepID=UPI003D257192